MARGVKVPKIGRMWAMLPYHPAWQDDGPPIIPVRGCPDGLISAQARVGTGGGRISRILGVPPWAQGPWAQGPSAQSPWAQGPWA